MDPERWERLQRLFHEAADLPPDERDSFLRRNEPDAEMRAKVRELLTADARTDALEPLARRELSDILDAPVPESSLEGRRIGPYRVLRRIGQGGMGAVYLAERDDVSKKVALKVVRGALGAPELVRRFLLERRVLARLEHPRIARLLDAGVTADETPWLAMEYVEGEAMTLYCERNELPAAGRLRLFRDVCDAVGYAHSNLIVHRDIKPSNVLVTPDSQVKLLDFGIAKLLGEEAEDAALTRTGVRLMSPAYAAPEQASGSPVTTATDVYSLGVLLRELLTGEAPEAGSEEAETRGTRSLSGDLRAIVVRAMEPEPERRYRSAEQLRDDITRHLEGRPVQARLPTFRYRAGKFVRRNSVAVTGAFLIALSLSGGLGAAIWQGRRAEAARRRAETELTRSETVTSFLTDLFRAADPAEAKGRQVTADELVDRGVQRIGQLGSDPPLQARLLQTLAGVDDALGDYARATDLAARAVAIRRKSPPDSALVSALNLWGTVLDHRGLPDSAASVWGEALRRGTEILGEQSSEALFARGQMANAYARMGRDSAAEALLRQTVDIQRRTLAADDPERAEALNDLALQLTNEGHFAEAEARMKEAVRIQESAHGDDDPDTGMLLDNYAFVLRSAGKYDEAEPIDRKGLAIRRKVLGDKHRFYGESLFSLGTLLAMRGRPADFAEADSLLHGALDIFVATLGPDHRATAYVLQSLGLLAERRGDLPGAERWYRRALDIRRGSTKDNPAVTVRTLTALARVLRKRGSSEAEKMAREAVTLAEARLPAAHPERGKAEAELGLVLAATGDTAQGHARFVAGVATVAKRFGASHPEVTELCEEAAHAGIGVAPACHAEHGR